MAFRALAAGVGGAACLALVYVIYVDGAGLLTAVFSVATFAVCILFYTLTFDGGCDTKLVGAGVTGVAGAAVVVAAAAAFTSVFVVTPAATLL